MRRNRQMPMSCTYRASKGRYQSLDESATSITNIHRELFFAKENVAFGVTMFDNNRGAPESLARCCVVA